MINFNEQTTFDIAQKCIKFDCKKIGKEIDSEMEMERFLQRFFFDKNDNIIEENYKLYRQSILKISSQEFQNSFNNKRMREIKEINSKIYGDYFLIDTPIYAKYGPGFYYFSFKDLSHRSNFLSQRLRLIWLK